MNSNHILRKIKQLGQLSEGTFLCTFDVVGLYPNIPHDESLSFLKDVLESRVDQQITTDTLIELIELVLKNNLFEFSEETYKQICETEIDGVCSTIYIPFLATLEEKILSKVKKNQVFREGILTIYSLFGNMVNNC